MFVEDDITYSRVVKKKNDTERHVLKWQRINTDDKKGRVKFICIMPRVNSSQRQDNNF